MVPQLPSLVPPCLSQSLWERHTPTSPLAVLHFEPDMGRILDNDGKLGKLLKENAGGDDVEDCGLLDSVINATVRFSVQVQCNLENLDIDLLLRYLRI